LLFGLFEEDAGAVLLFSVDRNGAVKASYEVHALLKRRNISKHQL
jgi:hypothetical protein